MRTTLLWIYIVLLVIGGLIGFLKAKSRVSLIMSVAFASALSCCALGIIFRPRRVGARTVAARVAWERSCPLGAEVGYQSRFDDQTSLGTRISYVTEGILLRWLQDNPTLSDVGAVLFDEFHERNLLSDVALALVKHLQRTERPDLKMAAMSATLEAEAVAEYLRDSLKSKVQSPKSEAPRQESRVRSQEAGAQNEG